MSDAIPVNRIKGVGEKTAALFGRINVFTVEDLIGHYPRDYETYDAPVSIREVSAGSVQAIYGQITAIPNVKKVRNLSILNAVLTDDNGDSIQLTFFNMPFLKKVLKPGGFYLFRGLVQQRGTHKIMEQPRMFTWEEYQKKSGRLLPRYALTKGLTNQMVQKSVAQALEYYPPEKEYLPQSVLQKIPMLSHREAVNSLHFPENREELLAARNRIVFEEFFSFLLVLRKNKDLAAKTENHFPMYETADTVRFLEQLPFPLTKAQKKVWGELREDMGSPYAMNRLIQGDVGSGKTILAVLALLMCAANGYQGAMMAPTEVLAVQHFETISGYVEKYGIAFRPVLLTGSMTAKEKREAYAKIASGEANLIIGTHALIQEKVEYSSLALVVTDEQHRFGVRQRETLAAKGKEPHVLVMSATPIPRTLGLLMYGDLDISILDELPPGRKPVKTRCITGKKRADLYGFLDREIDSGRQVYIVCPAIEDAGGSGLNAVKSYYEDIAKAYLPDRRVGLMHGKLKPKEKAEVMDDFKSGRLDALVSTTVIEVGVDVPNATVMVIENAERYGLSALHQLRGRVGRGAAESWCFLVSDNASESVQKRLKFLCSTSDGFAVAQYDLETRGPGDFFGSRQHGLPTLQIADLMNDTRTLHAAQSEAVALLAEDPLLERPEHALLARQVEQMFDKAGTMN